MDRSETINTTLLHAEQVWNQLQNHSAPATAECETLLQDLDSLRTYAGTDTKPEENTEIMTMNIEELYQSFMEQAGNSAQRLQGILDLVAAARVPSPERIAELNAAVAELRGQYDALYRCTRSMLPEEEMPGEEASATELIEAVRTSQALRLKRLIEEAEACLMRFLSVYSPVSRYAQDLLPFQAQADELLARIHAGDVDPEQLEDLTAVPRAFLLAFDHEDKDSDEGLVLCDRVEDLFGGHVHTGIIAGKYQTDLPAQPEASPAEAPAQNEIVPPAAPEAPEQTSELPSAGIEEDTAPEAPSSEAEKTENAAETPEPGASEESDAAGESAPDAVPAEDSNPETEAADPEAAGSADDTPGRNLAEILRKNSFFRISGRGFDRTERNLNPNEGKKISSSIFSKEINTAKGIEMIIRQLTRLNTLSLRMMTGPMHMPARLAEAHLGFLFQKGYIREFKVHPGGCFYGPSPRLISALSNATPCRRVGIARRSAEDWGEIEMEKASMIAARVAATEIYTDIASYNAKKTPKKVAPGDTTISTAPESFCAHMTQENSTGLVVFAGAFWTDDPGEECGAFIQELQRMLHDLPEISAIILSAVDFANALTLADAVRSVLRLDFSTISGFLYSLTDNKYYHYPSLEPLDEEGIPQEDNSSVSSKGPSGDGNPSSGSESGVSGSAADVPQTESEPESAEPAPAVPAPEPRAARSQKKFTPGQQVRLPARESAPRKAGSPGEQSPAVPAVPKPAQLTFRDEIRGNVCQMLCSRQFYAAAAYLKALGNTEDADKLYSLLAYALNDPMGHCSYSSENAFRQISAADTLECYLTVSTALRLLFSNQVQYDFNLKSFHGYISSDMTLNERILSRYPALNSILYELVSFKDTNKKGLDAYADYHAKTRTDLDEKFLALQRDAEDFYRNYIEGHKTDRCRQKQFIATKTLMFSKDSDLGVYLKSVADGDLESEPIVTDFLREHFFDEEAVISVETLSSSRIRAYIQEYWEQAATQLYFRQHETLKSRLLSNIISVTTKAVQLLARWSSLAEQMKNLADDDGRLAYLKIRNTLHDSLEEALTGVRGALETAPIGSEEAAGITVLADTLFDLTACIDGTYNEGQRNYFYAPFLLTDHVTLGEDLMPDIDVHNSTLKSLQADQRILAHAERVKQSGLNYMDRLHEILDEQGDDYGSARQIVEYLSFSRPDLDLSKIETQIDDGESYADEYAGIARDDFIGELELAQSYGQIDNSQEDRKEMILQVVEDWYEWALDTKNYGFFRRVMTAYLQDIRESAKSREPGFYEQLEKYRTETIPGLSVEAKAARIARIQEMIRVQNYTVAEDMLARFTIIEDDRGIQVEEDFLRDFLNNYDDYYRPVSKNSASFASLVSSRTRNKEERGARRLAESWLPGGSQLGQDRLGSLLTGLGFHVASIQPQTALHRYESYTVKTLAVDNGQRVNFTHPIAAFGSGAAQDGFRVVCINGVYDATELIDIMKTIGDTKHTLILLDCALSKSERRRLARKSKMDLGEKLFAVLDRTVMMFLFRNYDETKINRMLVSLVTPFGFYQPYVWDSAKVMPPEIFMGRKTDLERIKSASGVNIVYGGRQLGKSALLKKARDDIDCNENGDRAIYIEIKSLNYEQAARKIGHELYDQKVLESDIDTTDWDDLARAVKRRLQSDSPTRIPYLLLLLDEADTFIESCESVNFRPFDALKDIQSIGVGRFKFVIAGLRNVVRFKREAALGNNSVLTQLQSMTVTPFSTREGRELLEVPLHYLGLRFPREKESLTSLILATTNYFPGLIQMYCAKLLEAMRNKDYAGYDEVNSPIYEVSEGHIKKVLADPSFNQQIREKYEITLKLDEDDYYYIIALLMAYRYHTKGYTNGCSAAEIRQTGAELGIGRIASLEESKLNALMEEMRELNVLRNTDRTHYLFSRVRFFQMMGTITDVEDRLTKYLED